MANDHDPYCLSSQIWQPADKVTGSLRDRRRQEFGFGKLVDIGALRQVYDRLRDERFLDASPCLYKGSVFSRSS